MNTQTRRQSQKSIALRAVVSGLLASPLSDSELKKFAQDLDLEFLSNLREMLLSLPFRGNDFSEDIPPPLENDESLVEMILESAKRRRLSKGQVYNHMHGVDASLTKSVVRPENTLRESIERFVTNSGAETGHQLLSRMLGNVEQDPYLTGISKRK